VKLRQASGLAQTGLKLGQQRRLLLNQAAEFSDFPALLRRLLLFIVQLPLLLRDFLLSLGPPNGAAPSQKKQPGAR